MGVAFQKVIGGHHGQFPVAEGAAFLHDGHGLGHRRRFQVALVDLLSNVIQLFLHGDLAFGEERAPIGASSNEQDKQYGKKHRYTHAQH